MVYRKWYNPLLLTSIDLLPSEKSNRDTEQVQYSKTSINFQEKDHL